MDENLANKEKQAFESKAPKLYSGTGKAPVVLKASRAKLILRKAGPLGAIVALFVGVGLLFVGSQSLMPVAISEMIIEKLNSVGVSTTATSDAWLDLQFNNGVKADGDDSNKYGFSSAQISSFERQGMKVVTTSSGALAVVYNRSGTMVPVVGSNYVGSVSASEIASAGNLTNVVTPISVKEALNDNYFKTPYTAASKTWRGGSSGWFDKLMSNITETKLSIRRNRWSRFTAVSADKLTEKFKQIAASAERTKTTDAASGATRFFSVDEYDNSGLSEGATFTPSTGSNSNGKETAFYGNWTATSGNPNGEVMTVTNVTPVYETIDLGDGKTEEILIGYDVSGNNNSSLVKNTDDVGKLGSALSAKAQKVAATAATAADTTCSIIEGLMSIYTVVSAYQSIQFLNLVTGYLESVDKMKAGDGENSPINEYTKNLVTVGDTVETKSDGSQEVVARKTAMESKGMEWLFTNNAIDSNDTSVKNVNFESLMAGLGGLVGNISLTAKAFEACGYVRVATATTNLVLTAMSFIPVAGQAITLTQVAVRIGAQVAVSAVVAGFFSAVIPVIAKKVVNSIVKDTATEWFGEDLGNAMMLGAGKYLGGNGTTGGQGPGSKEKVIAYLGEQQTVIADEAKYQRAIRSPFDITSPYTFMGSLVYSILPMAYSSSGLMSVVRSMSSLTSNSLVALSPTANAVDVNSSITSTGDCPLLETVGIQGDAYCNPYIITDTSTIKDSPIEVENKVRNTLDSKGRNNFNSDGSINGKSDLAKYITFCGQRTSPYGLKDSTIVDGLTGEAKEINDQNTSWWQKLFSFIPGINDAQNVLQSLQDASVLQWTTGEACVVSDDNPYWNGTVTDKITGEIGEYHLQDYQRYTENERLLENMSPNYKSAVTAYLEKYYEENPVDDSFEGQIARFSGMSMDEVENTIALIEYYEFLAEYDASTRYAFKAPVVEVQEELNFGDGEVVVYAILPENITYSDVRNRVNVI